MLSVSNNFKTEIKKLEVYSDGKVSITNTSGTLNFTRDNIVKIDIFGSAFSNDKVLGNLAQHSLTLELLGDLTSSIALNKENIVKVDIGVLVNGVYEYVRFQDFLVTSVIYSDTSNVTQIVATDSIVKLNTEYVDTNVYPITLKAYLEDVLTQCGLELENTTFLNDNFVITSRPYNDGSSCKDIVSRISELALCFAQINKVSNKLELVNAFSPFMRGYTHTELSAFTHTQLSAYTHYELMHSIGLYDETISKDNYWNFKLSDHWFGEFGINTLTLKISQVEGENNTKQVDELVSLEGNKSITISDNPFINSEALRLSVIDGMFDVVKFYKYYPYTLEYRGFPYLELGDSVQITNMNGDLFNSPIYEMTIRYDGGLYGKINASALSQVQTQYLNTQTLSQRVKTAEVKVDKINGDVTILAGDYYDGKLVGTYYNFDGEAFTITNASDEVVFSADSLGNLTLVGDIRGVKDGITRVELTEDSLKFTTETSATIAYLSAFNSVDTRAFTISNGTNSGDGVRFRIDDHATTNLFLARIEAEAGDNTARFEASVEEGSLFPSALLTSSTKPLSNILDQGSVSAGGSSTFMGNTKINLDTFAQQNTYIRTNALGEIQFNSSVENYKIYIGGSLRTITRDANGFLKAV